MIQPSADHQHSTEKNTAGSQHTHTAAENGHTENASAAAEHEHAHGGVFGKNTELLFSLICGALLGIGFGLSFISSIPSWVSLSLYIGAYFFGGYFTATEAVEFVRKGKFEIDFLMLVAAIGAAILGDWAEGALLLFLFSMGHALEHYAMNKARKSIAALADLAPKTAIVRRNNEEKEIGIEALVAGDIIIVKPNSKISADGVVVKGNSSVNQAPITGESVPVDKSPVADPGKDYSQIKNINAENKVFAGTINGSQVLEVQVTRVTADSTLARLIKLVNETEAQKSPTQLFTDKFERYFVPLVLLLVVLLLFAFLVIDEPFSKSFYRAISVLVAASPCALAISTPSAVLSGIARAARSGVLIKGGGPLEELGSLTALAFDKTGTLTEGKPRLTGVVPLNGITAEALLEAVIAVEKLSDHPLAAAIVKGGQERLKKEVPAAENLQAVTGRGVRATYNGKKIVIGNLALFEQDNAAIGDNIYQQVAQLEKEGNTTMLAQQDGTLIGIIALMDIPREEAAETLTRLKEIGIRKMIMLTGDNQQVADAVARQIGITEAWGGLLPEQKVKAIQDLNQQEGKVAMIGDGVNDAPAMAKSTVGIAMGAAGSDVALETADIALMADKLDNLPFAIALSRKSKGIIRQNLWMSLGMVALLIPLTIAGIASIGGAVIVHEGSTLLVVFNGLRLLAFRLKK
ncbi:heavy metal translocating P-type ATPase [Chitinophaga nivalis]|uniref:P-type Zn(2+) transporter n=1 Tax=Chitinophaga nivalis TaxID=2991709 RepID=A0ABT3IGQ7_9BACT|nr:heavy metal translocating P-type ATPase [Chitinophaga nivalis]MCW3467169.1 heavy metal translocating P-type ATPase [Chitinophaga nivalis]MCW3483139.1 heavy metal translocating P-type ATPase [Chitinophaga nivalis]